jgi:ribonuclease T1
MNLSWTKAFRWMRVLPLIVAMLFVSTLTFADSQGSANYFTLQEIELAALPLEAATTLRLIKQGGPFPYSRDGVVFGNYEKRLPRKRRGYYHEYTVKTPGMRSRGARRIVCGQAAECYYTADHYETFKRIRE